MRLLALVALAALVLASAASAAGETSDGGGLWQASRHSGPWSFSPVGTSTVHQTTLEAALVRTINDVRRDHGLKPLVVSSKLATAAAQHTREMGVRGYFEHESFDSTSFWKRIERWYPSKGWQSWSVGENLLYSSPSVTASSGVDLWMNSPPHRANLLSRTWREIGISAMHFETAPGEYADGAVTIVTADFGMRR